MFWDTWIARTTELESIIYIITVQGLGREFCWQENGMCKVCREFCGEIEDVNLQHSQAGMEIHSEVSKKVAFKSIKAIYI